jgi:secreted trypsin-like serine protease
MMKKLCLITLSIVLTSCNNGSSPLNKDNNLNISDKTPLVQNGDVSTNANINAIVPAIENTKLGTLCSSTLITPEYILTAAHCVVQMKYKLYGDVYGNNDISQAKDIKVLYPSNPSIGAVNLINNRASYKVANVKKITIHHGAYKGAATTADGSLSIIDETEINDLAIIQLESPIILSSNYKYPQLANESYKQFSQLITAGYGLNSGTGVVKPDPYNGQSGVLRTANTQLERYRGSNKLVNIIKYDNGVYYKTCQGDSGGPDFIVQNSNLVIVGVHSFGSGKDCGIFYSPGTSVSVNAYEAWIKQQIKPTADYYAINLNMTVCSSLDDKICDKKLSDIKINQSGIVKLLITPSNAVSIKEFTIKSISYLPSEGWSIFPIGQNCTLGDDLTSTKPCLLTMNYIPRISSKESGSLNINYSFKNNDGQIINSTYEFLYYRRN